MQKEQAPDLETAPEVISWQSEYPDILHPQLNDNCRTVMRLALKQLMSEEQG